MVPTPAPAEHKSDYDKLLDLFLHAHGFGTSVIGSKDFATSPDSLWIAVVDDKTDGIAFLFDPQTEAMTGIRANHGLSIGG